MRPQPMSGAPETPATCLGPGCADPAAYACDRCGRAYCAGHLQLASLERRPDPAAAARHSWDLTRVPSRIETYRLCARCGKKPFSGHRLPDGVR